MKNSQQSKHLCLAPHLIIKIIHIGRLIYLHQSHHKRSEAYIQSFELDFVNMRKGCIP